MKGVECFDFICALLCTYTSSFGGRLHNIRKSWSNTSISPSTKSVSGHSMLAFACTYRCLVVFLHMLVGNRFFKNKQFQALRYFRQKHICHMLMCFSATSWVPKASNFWQSLSTKFCFRFRRWGRNHFVSWEVKGTPEAWGGPLRFPWFWG